MSSDSRNGQRSRKDSEHQQLADGAAQGGRRGVGANDGSGSGEIGLDTPSSVGGGNPPQSVGANGAGEARNLAGGGKTVSASGDFDPLAALRDRLLRGSESPYGLDADPCRDDYPAVWKLLTQRVGTKGRAKQPATVRIEATSTGFRATISDLTLSVALSVESEYMEGLWAALERGIRDPRAPWRELRHGERANAVKARNSKNPVDWES